MMVARFTGVLEIERDAKADDWTSEHRHELLHDDPTPDVMVNISSAPMHAVRTGPRGGVPVVLIHAVGLDLTYWSHQIEALCDRYDVLAFDLPGHGRSAGTPQDWTLDQAAEMLRGVVRTTSHRNVHLVGLSVGGMIAQAMMFDWRATR